MEKLHPYLLFFKNKSIFKQEFSIAQRSLRIASEVPDFCAAGGQLENIEFECTIPSICVPEIEGTFSFEASHTQYTRLRQDVEKLRKILRLGENIKIVEVCLESCFKQRDEIEKDMLMLKESNISVTLSPHTLVPKQSSPSHSRFRSPLPPLLSSQKFSHSLMATECSIKAVKEVKKKKKVKKEEKVVVTEKKVRKERKVYDLPGQKRDPPEERDPLRIFYETLHEQIPSSEMSQIWLMESGLLPKEVAKKVFEKKQKKTRQQKVTSPVNSVSSVKKKSTKSVTTTTTKTTKSVTVKEKSPTTLNSSGKKETTNSASKPVKKRKSACTSSEDDDSDFDIGSATTKRRKVA